MGNFVEYCLTVPKEGTKNWGCYYKNFAIASKIPSTFLNVSYANNNAHNIKQIEYTNCQQID